MKKYETEVTPYIDDVQVYRAYNDDKYTVLYRTPEGTYLALRGKRQPLFNNFIKAISGEVITVSEDDFYNPPIERWIPTDDTIDEIQKLPRKWLLEFILNEKIGEPDKSFTALSSRFYAMKKVLTEKGYEVSE